MEVAFLGPMTTAAGPPHCNFIDWPTVLEKLSIVAKLGGKGQKHAGLSRASPASVPATRRAGGPACLFCCQL